MEMNERIKKIRKDNKLTMEQFGEKISISKVSVSRLESGINNPSEQTIALICKEFNINEEWLRTGKGNEKNTSSITDEYMKACRELGITDKRLIQIILNYSRFNARDKKAFWDFVDRLTSGDFDFLLDDDDDCDDAESEN